MDKRTTLKDKNQLKFVLIIQGEGRGHMTQAIALTDLLQRNGHKVVKAFIGKSRQRQIPEFFYKKINIPVTEIESPNFVLKKNHKGIRVFYSIWINLKKRKTFFKSIDEINREIEKSKPDVVINFYELLGGLYFMKYKTKTRHICIAHQYLLDHPETEMPEGNYVNKMLLYINNKITSYGAEKKLALSFREMRNVSQKKIYVVPPLLRKEVLEMKPGVKDYILGYMLNPGYSDIIEEWHIKHPECRAVFFWDKRDEPDQKEMNANLVYYRINDVRFLEMMKYCRGFITTAGFESICEAMFLEKPVLMVPSENHFEQQCNALDGVKAGAGIKSERYDPQLLVEYIPQHENSYDKYKEWVRKSGQYFLKYLQ